MKGVVVKALWVTAGVIAIRILLEEMGAPDLATEALGVVWLQLLVPVYFGFWGPISEKPYRRLLLAVLIYTLVARLMVVISYTLAYLFEWRAFRFTVEGGGVVGEGVTPLDGLLVIAALNQRFWIIAGLIVGASIGPASLFIRRRWIGR